jgi:hypothetical protein
VWPVISPAASIVAHCKGEVFAGVLDAGLNKTLVLLPVA